MDEEQWVRYELTEQTTDGKSYRRVWSTNEPNEQKAIAELTTKAKEKRKYDKDMMYFVNFGKLGKMRIQKCYVKVVVERVEL